MNYSECEHFLLTYLQVDTFLVSFIGLITALVVYDLLCDGILIFRNFLKPKRHAADEIIDFSEEAQQAQDLNKTGNAFNSVVSRSGVTADSGTRGGNYDS